MSPYFFLCIFGVAFLLLGFLGFGESWMMFGVVMAVVGVAKMGVGGLKKLNQLQRGMSLAQVKEILGEPRQTELIEGRTVYKYSLHEFASGWKPAYLAFDEDGRLTSWSVDQQEFERETDRWMKAAKAFRKSQQG